MLAGMTLRQVLHWSNMLAIGGLLWTALLLLAGSPELPWSHWLPDSFYTATRLANRNDEGRVWHIVLSLVLIFIWLGYAVYFRPRRRGPRLRAQRPWYRVAYAAVIIAIAGEILTGLPMYVHGWTGFANVLGGEEAIRFEHFGLTFVIVVFVAIHIVQAITGGWMRFRRMAGYALPLIALVAITIGVVAHLQAGNDGVPPFLNWARDTDER